MLIAFWNEFKRIVDRLLDRDRKIKTVIIILNQTKVLSRDDLHIEAVLLEEIENPRVQEFPQKLNSQAGHFCHHLCPGGLPSRQKYRPKHLHHLLRPEQDRQQTLERGLPSS